MSTQDFAKAMEGCSITTGIVRYNDLCYLSIVDNEQLKDITNIHTIQKLIGAFGGVTA
jgi:hypothetical protein